MKFNVNHQLEKFFFFQEKMSIGKPQNHEALGMKKLTVGDSLFLLHEA
jgi:hypothetical protein